MESSRPTVYINMNRIPPLPLETHLNLFKLTLSK
jgi:hypothetical protein